MNVLERIPFHPNQAIVFDIDDTLIHSRTHAPIASTAQLYKYCRAKGYHIYIITARPFFPRNAHITAQQLHQHAVVCHTGPPEGEFERQWPRIRSIRASVKSYSTR